MSVECGCKWIAVVTYFGVLNCWPKAIRRHLSCWIFPSFSFAPNRSRSSSRPLAINNSLGSTQTHTERNDHRPPANIMWLRRGLLPAKPFAAQKRVDVVTCSRRTNGGIHRRRYKVKAENGIYCVVPPNEDELRWPLELCWTAKSKKNVIFLSFKAATEYTE